jgi:hypothetical protein
MLDKILGHCQQERMFKDVLVKEVSISHVFLRDQWKVILSLRKFLSERLIN